MERVGTWRAMKTPWRAREDTREDKRRHPGGQENTSWRAREDIMEGKRRHPGGQEKTPWRAREDETDRGNIGWIIYRYGPSKVTDPMHSRRQHKAGEE